MSVIDQILNTQEFATLPAVATKILEFIDSDDVSLSDLGKIMESDPSLTMKIIKISNSPLYATRVEVTNINQAIATLGLNRVSNIVLGVSIFSKFMVSSDKKLAELIDKFWTHSSSTAIVAKTIAEKLKARYGEKEFLTGLLHDIGKLALIQFQPEKYLQVINEVEKGKNIIEAEEEVFETNHFKVVDAIAEKWRLPEDLHNMVNLKMNTNFTKAENDVISIVNLANNLCEVWGAGFFDGFQEIDIEQNPNWTYLAENFENMEEFDIEVFTFELEQEFKNSTDFLDMIKS